MSRDTIRILSPHLDDAVLSLGGAIAEWHQRGIDVEVFTCLSADEPAGPVSPLVTRLHRAFGLERGVVAARREEDRLAVEHLGARAVHADLPEGIYRTDADGRALYPDLGALFRDLRPEDRELEERLAGRLRALEAARRCLVPLGVGGHVDHLLVRRAAESAASELGAEILFYEEVPYVMKWRALSRALGDRSSWEPEQIPVSESSLECKIEAVAAYRSQLRPLFGSEGAMARKLGRFHRKRGRGERLWRRREA